MQQNPSSQNYSSQNPSSQSEQVVVITGCSNGFGADAARTFADAGYRVWATMRASNGRNAGAAAALRAHSDRIKVLDMDVGDDASVTSAFATILNEGPVDILINNAGIMYLGITEAFSLAQVQEQMNVNYLGAIRTSQAVLPAMREAGSGLIIQCSSLVGRISLPFFGSYTASKHALEGYSQALRYEVAPFGVDIAIVEPGPFGTGLLAGGATPALDEVSASYGELAQVCANMKAGFAAMFQSDEAPDPALVVQAYLDLAKRPAGQRPTRTVVGFDWGVNEINAATQPLQDATLTQMGLESVLGGVSVG